MRQLIAVGRLLRLVLHVLRGLFIVQCLFGRLDAAGRQRHIKAWSAQLLRVLGIELCVKGELVPGARLLVANHVSWLDIPVVHALMPEARFVSKAAIKTWPLIGKMVDSAGTLYLERSSKRDALRVVHQVADALGAGDTVAFFPEGTTGSGPELLPFHGNLLQSAIATQTPVQPLALRWFEPAQRFSRAAEFVGDTTLVESVWRILCARGLAVDLQLMQQRPVTSHDDRRMLADALREQIAAAVKT